MSSGERDADEYRNIVAKKQRDNPDALIAEDREIMAATEKLAKRDQSHAEIEKTLNESEALSTRAMKKLSEKQIIFQDQAKLKKGIKKGVTLMQHVLKIRQLSRLHKIQSEREGICRDE